MNSPEIRCVGVYCNCGFMHPSFEEWQKCPMALTPRPLKPWWRDLPPPSTNQAKGIAGLYRHYMREQGIGLYRLAQRLNDAWRRRGQKPRLRWR